MRFHSPIAIIDASPTEARIFSKRIASLIDLQEHDGKVSKFKDGETKIVIDQSVRGHDAYLFQAYMPQIGERLYELQNMTSACRTGGQAAKVTAVMPYCFGQRGERPTRARESVPAAVVARTLYSVGIRKVLTTGLHTDAIQTIFDVVGDDGIKVEHLEFQPLAANYSLRVAKERGYSHLAFGSPDSGGTKRARNLRKVVMSKRGDLELTSSIATADKYRADDDVVEVEELAGDVAGKPVILYDDIGDTLGTIKGAVELYAKHGAGPIHVVLIHPVLGDGYERNLESIVNNHCVAEVVFGNTLPLKPLARSLDKVKIVPLEPFFAQAIRRLNKDESISELHDYDQIMGIYREYSTNVNIEKDKKELILG
ncbi:ribose-phosphate diphosphokinase [Candidatus Woesearchaeota archaeon]|nr:ribose-phosphate diphosphokinase [Candidatus Woesearchaeota archaeon]